jgi:hypothetical protein
MASLTPAHLGILEQLVAKGFLPAAFPMIEAAIGIRRGAFAALLDPVSDGTFRLLGQAFYLMDGNLSVRVRRDGREWFVCKGKQIEATRRLLDELAQFSADLSTQLSEQI